MAAKLLMPTLSKKKLALRGAAPERKPRNDGTATRHHLLEIAGTVFAQRGVDGATSKEICERAGTPLASVNYHFGSREALYEAVLIEAHRQLIGIDEMMAAVEEPSAPRERLRAIVGKLAGLSMRADTPWGCRVLLREMMSPSNALPTLVEEAIRPKAELMIRLMAELLALPRSHPAVQRGVLFTVMPCIALMIAPKNMPASLTPAAFGDTDAFVSAFTDYTLAGLDHLAKAYAVKPSRKRAS